MYKIGLHPETNEPCAVNRFDESGNFLCSIPFDPDNTDYKEYLRWLEAGNQPLPAESK